MLRPSRRLTVTTERLRVRREHVAADRGADPYAPATLSTSVDRQTFREVLAAGLDGRIAFGHELARHEADADGVRLYFADGQEAEADVLVGADGVGSAVRRQYLPAASPADGGARCIYGNAALLSRLLGTVAADGSDVVAAIGDYERQMREYGYAAVAASRQAEAQTGARRNWLLFWLYRRLARS